MLHRIQLCPHCEKILMAVLRLQEAILVYACASASVWLPSVADFPTMAPSAAQWFIGKLQRGAKLTKFGTALKALFDHVRDDPLGGQEIVEAFQNDVKFPSSVDDPVFEFQFALRLDAATQKVVKELMVLFYETLAGANFPSAVHGEPEDFTRDLLLEGFERANPKLQVCPACDGQKPSKIEAKLLADADHYLPKSLYPFLAVHPGNLVPVCLECNQRIKGDTDPVLDHATTPLANIFLPYVVPASEHLELCIRRDGGKGLAIEFHDRSAPGSRRVESLQAIFALDKRWPGRLDGQKDSVVDALMAAGERRRDAGEEVSEQVLESLLTTSPREAERYTGRSPFFLLKRSYQEFALHDPAEKLGLIAQFEGK
ncbi:MAG TPA: hypothetical protein VJU77_15480 [Chthoniobacterales bacterium]|nr:hypothetical protein [Chthoniobacterales bacterium]